MPAQSIEVKRQGKTGLLVSEEPLGAVFAPVPGRRMRPAFSFGSPRAATREVMFTCPVSAIPDAVWEALDLWNRCRLTGTLPVAGGLIDQPMVVQRAFPIFEIERRAAEQAGGTSPEKAAALAVGALMKAMGSGRRR